MDSVGLRFYPQFFARHGFSGIGMNETASTKFYARSRDMRRGGAQSSVSVPSNSASVYTAGYIENMTSVCLTC